MEIKVFSELDGVIFEYPVFEGWEVSKIEKKDKYEYFIYFYWPKTFDLGKAPRVRVLKTPWLSLNSARADVPKGDGRTNPNGVRYERVFEPSLYFQKSKPEDGYWNCLEFYGESAGVRISRYSGVKEQGFDEDVFYDTVIGTFKFRGAMLASPHSFACPEAAKAVAECLKGDGDDPSKFYCDAKSVKKEGNMLVFPVYDNTAFKAVGVMGNPSGRCRDIYYDTKTKKVAKELFWQ